MSEIDDLRAEVRRLRSVIDRAANALYRGFGASKLELARIAAEVRRILRAEVPAKKDTEEIMKDGEKRTYGAIVMEYRAGLGIIPANSPTFESQRPRFPTWAAAEDWAWASQANPLPLDDPQQE